MKPSEIQSSGTSYIGHVKNGVVVLDEPFVLNEGQTVRVELLDEGPGSRLEKERADRVRELQKRFAEWTEEDGKLPDEEADRLHTSLEKSRGLTFRTPNLD